MAEAVKTNTILEFLMPEKKTKEIGLLMSFCWSMTFLTTGIISTEYGPF